MTGTVRRSRFEPGQRVRLNLPGSKLHGVTGVLKAPRPPAGWWLVVADAELEQPEGEALDGDLGRSFIAPDVWLDVVDSGADFGAKMTALGVGDCDALTSHWLRRPRS